MSNEVLREMTKTIVDLRARIEALETAEVIPSQLQASDGDPNPCLSADASGNLTQADGLYIATDEIRARDAGGLKLYEDGGKGIFVEDSTGYVGIGTTSPGKLLDVQSSTTNAVIHAKSTSGGGYLDLQGSNNYSSVNFFTDAGTEEWRIGKRGDDDLYFQRASGSGNVIIDNGKVGIGDATPSYQLELSTNSAAKPTSTLWTVPSDTRLKKNIRPFTDGLSILEQINPIRYQYNGKASTPLNANGIGVEADKLLDILPDCVTTSKKKLMETDEKETELLGFDGSAMLFVMVNSIKEVAVRLDKLEKK